MVILSLDTTTRAGSCALWRDGALVEERVGDPARTHAERLPGDLAGLLAAHRLTVADVDLYAVASGPGSFTGLRVGIATIQGLALVHGRKVVPVPTLEALAVSGVHDVPQAHVVGAWMEAYRGEVFGALYVASNIEEIEPPAVASPESLAAQWSRRVDDVSVVIGDAVPATRDLLHAAFPGALLRDAVPLAATIARLAYEAPEYAVLPHAIVPVYVRRPDAELARDRKAASTT